MQLAPRRRARTVRSIALAAAAVLLLAGCAPGEAAPAGTTTGAGGAAGPADLPAGVEVELYQLRSDVAERGAQIRVLNGSDEDLKVTRVTFEDDWFLEPSIRERESLIAAGRTVDLRIALPESACEDEPDAAARTSRVSLEFSLAGEPRIAVVDVADPLGFTALVHEKECLRHDLAQLASLQWTSFTPMPAPQPAKLVLSIAPPPDPSPGAGALTRVETTNLLQFAAQPAPFALGIDLPLASASADVVVPLLPLRCDPHAVMEDKRGTVFNVAVEVDAASGVVEVAASEQMRGEILRWVADWCGFGPG